MPALPGPRPRHGAARATVQRARPAAAGAVGLAHARPLARAGAAEFHRPRISHGSLFYVKGKMQNTPRNPSRFVACAATEGWARRFLQEMFSKYAVLFVGYSHNDPVMHYLARGLPSSAEGRRFALTPEGQERFWKHLGIVALAYRKRRGKDPHRELGLALARWVTLTAERPLDKRERIRGITSRLPPGAGEDHDYLVNALNDEYTARFFAEFARISSSTG